MFNQSFVGWKKRKVINLPNYKSNYVEYLIFTLFWVRTLFYVRVCAACWDHCQLTRRLRSSRSIRSLIVTGERLREGNGGCADPDCALLWQAARPVSNRKPSHSRKGHGSRIWQTQTHSGQLLSENYNIEASESNTGGRKKLQNALCHFLFHFSSIMSVISAGVSSVCSAVTSFVTICNCFKKTSKFLHFLPAMKRSSIWASVWCSLAQVDRPGSVCAHLWAVEGSSAPAGSGGCPSEDSGSPGAGAAPRGWAEPCRCRTSGSLRGSLRFGSSYTGAQWKTLSRRTEGGGKHFRERERERKRCVNISYKWENCQQNTWRRNVSDFKLISLSDIWCI